MYRVTKKTTVDEVLSWNQSERLATLGNDLCSREILETEWSKKELCAKEILGLDLPAETRLWIVLREELLPMTIINELNFQFVSKAIDVCSEIHKIDSCIRECHREVGIYLKQPRDGDFSYLESLIDQTHDLGKYYAHQSELYPDSIRGLAESTMHYLATGTCYEAISTAKYFKNQLYDEIPDDIPTCICNDCRNAIASAKMAKKLVLEQLANKSNREITTLRFPPQSISELETEIQDALEQFLRYARSALKTSDDATCETGAYSILEDANEQAVAIVLLGPSSRKLWIKCIPSLDPYKDIVLREIVESMDADLHKPYSFSVKSKPTWAFVRSPFYHQSIDVSDPQKTLWELWRKTFQACRESFENESINLNCMLSSRSKLWWRE